MSTNNELFFEKASNHEGREKLAEAGGLYLRDRLRELSFTDPILPPQTVTRSDLQRSVDHDTMVRIRDVEPRSRAMSMSFRGQPDARYISAPRYAIAFFTISSEMFEKTEQELMAYEMPITKIIEENSLKDLQEIKDLRFLQYIEAAVQYMQVEANGGAAVALTSANVLSGAAKQYSVIKSESALARTLTNTTADFVASTHVKSDFVNLRKALHRKRLKASQILMTEPDFDNLSNYVVQDVGYDIVKETAIEGWKSSSVANLKIIRTIKTDILREGNLYVFTSPEFMGDSYVLNQPKFYIDKVANLFKWQCWMDIGIGIGNVQSIVKLECYPGSVTPGATTTGYLDALPSPESALGGQNNRVREGGTFPRISAY